MTTEQQVPEERTRYFLRIGIRDHDKTLYYSAYDNEVKRIIDETNVEGGVVWIYDEDQAAGILVPVSSLKYIQINEHDQQVPH